MSWYRRSQSQQPPAPPPPNPPEQVDTNQQVPSVLFHGTLKKNLASILSQGLIPGFNTVWGWSKSNVVYLGSNIHVATTFANPSDSNDEITVLEIDTNQLDKKLLSPDKNEGFEETSDSWEYAGPIPAIAISISKGYE